jgi:hypothetical protein
MIYIPKIVAGHFCLFHDAYKKHDANHAYNKLDSHDVNHAYNKLHNKHQIINVL